jgi:protein phosphatase
MASDGLTGVVPDKDLQNILGTLDDPQRAAVKLKDLALANDSKDNITCLIVHAVAHPDFVSASKDAATGGRS